MHDAVLRLAVIAAAITEFQRHRQLAEGALAQVDDGAFFRALGPRSHALAVIVKHMAGNLRSRWTDFLTTDGEKPDRHRDGEFALTADDTRPALMAAWAAGWDLAIEVVRGLSPADLERTITIRGEALPVPAAVARSVAHAAYHTGQITYLCRMLAQGEWTWLTIPPKGERGEGGREARQV